MKPAKKHRKVPAAQYRQVPIEEETAGRLFRVRDKDWEAVWGENLTHAEAHKLKEQVVTRGKSRTARIEDMAIDPPEGYASAADVATGKAPPTDAQLEQLRAKAKAASAAAAAAAQSRHQRAAARDRSSGAAAMKIAAPAPVISTTPPDDDDLGFADDGEIGDGDIADLLSDAGSDQPSEIELQRAKAKRDVDKAAITARAQAIYEAQRKEGHVGWDQLSPNAKAGWEFEATTAGVDKASTP